MTISPEDLQKIAQLAYLDVTVDPAVKLNQELNEIMDFVAELRSVDTSGVAPLFHALSVSPHVRTDTITEEDCLAELEALAPLFEENLYLVPQVIEQAK